MYASAVLARRTSETYLRMIAPASACLSGRKAAHTCSHRPGGTSLRAQIRPPFAINATALSTQTTGRGLAPAASRTSAPSGRLDRASLVSLVILLAASRWIVERDQAQERLAEDELQHFFGDHDSSPSLIFSF